MSMGADDIIRSLREAVRFSPDNVPLRQHLAETLLTYGRLDEAERELREAIAGAPASAALKTSLARVYLQAGKVSQSLVILEQLVKAAAPIGVEPALAMLYARVLHRSGQGQRAGHYYKLAVDADPSLADAILAADLAVAPTATPPKSFDEPAGHGEREHADAPTPAAPTAYTVERPTVSFADVGGMDAVKEEIRLKIIYPLQRPELFAAYGKKMGGGILMYGPPGCGKTHLARATAGEVKARFISVGIADVLNMWMGESERNLHELFEQARDSKPCVLFFDEVDALGASRTDLRHSAGRQLVNQFLSELDGVNAGNEGVLVLAATNAPWHIDPAFRRPGRFDRIIFVPPPDQPARSQITRLMLSGKPTDMVDTDQIAAKTDAFSGADLRAIVDIAVEAKLSKALKTPGAGLEPLKTADLLAAARSVRPSAREWFNTAKNHALYANQSGLYDSVLQYLKL